jgi:hypothetical protein
LQLTNYFLHHESTTLHFGYAFAYEESGFQLKKVESPTDQIKVKKVAMPSGWPEI